MLSFPRYRGIADHPPAEFNLIPSGGLFLRGEIAGIKAGVERYSFGSLDEVAWKMNITLYFRIAYNQNTYEYKQIFYEP